jgi:hypothetical protein
VLAEAKVRLGAVCGLLAAALLPGCGKPPPPDPNMTAIHARFGDLKLTWLTRRQVGGEAIVCGYAGPPRAAQVFIARAGRLYTPSDLPTGEFDRWEDGLCGPDWMKPYDGG